MHSDGSAATAMLGLAGFVLLAVCWPAPLHHLRDRHHRPVGPTARLLEVVPGRSGKALSDRVNLRPLEWRAVVAVAALDPFRGYATALTASLPHATRVLDCFHVTRLGFADPHPRPDPTVRITLPGIAHKFAVDTASRSCWPAVT